MFMAKKYEPKKIEKKWQRTWEKNRIYQAKDFSKKPKWYSLIEFPYPSGDGLHTGHIRSNTAMDIISRKRRMEGYNVLYPVGWDAFGLPTENYAIKTGIHPIKVTKKNTDTFRRQLKEIGFSFDWSREVNTSDPNYYRWTQWIFLQLFKKGLAYKQKTLINWCPKDKTGLANEEVINGCCERCGTPVEKKEKDQWMLAITKYADRLDKDLDKVDYLPQIKLQQRNWIGRSEGSQITFGLKAKGSKLKASVDVFTTRADTLFGVTYMVLAPEHPLLKQLLPEVENKEEVNKYIKKTLHETDTERTAENREKTGAELKGIKAINPANNEEVPVFIADYVLANYGTGAVMAVPAHDERDYAFAKKYNLSIKEVISGGDAQEKAFVDYGILVNSSKFNGLSSEKAIKEITKAVRGKMVTKYKLRDWVFSRQRYWGEPIPLVYCDKDGWVPVLEKDLPVKLPNIKEYQPTNDGESPLSRVPKWVNTKCPVCGGQAKRETDTMPNWAGSSWYFLRYIDPKNKKALADPKKLKYWTPVDWYNGGMEHTTLHLLYSRFWNKFLYDIGVVPLDEPYQKRTAQGMILGEGGVKMSKSKGNVVNPDDTVKLYGADTLRIYEMFMGPFDQSIAWSTESIIGSRRFLDKIWNIGQKIAKAKVVDSFDILTNQTIKKVSEDIEQMSFNTAISTMMVWVNEADKQETLAQNAFENFLKLLAPFAPHLAEELWSNLGHKKSIHLEAWPVFDKKKLQTKTVKIIVQINGKVRDSFELPTNSNQAEAEKIARERELVKKWLTGQAVRKVIYVPNRLLNFVV